MKKVCDGCGKLRGHYAPGDDGEFFFCFLCAKEAERSHLRDMREEARRARRDAKAWRKSGLSPGDSIRFARSDDTVQGDVVRDVVWQRLGERRGIAVVLTYHSWCWLRDVTEITERFEPGIGSTGKYGSFHRSEERT